MKKTTIEIETSNGDTLFSFVINSDNFDIDKFDNCSIADIDDDYINGYETLIRIQADEDNF